MEKYNLKEDVKVFGIMVKNFPEGIGQAFENLTQTITEGYDRSYYGITKITTEGIHYIAAAEEKYDDESAKYNCEKYIIEKGNYLIELIRDWRKKTDSIKEVFYEMFSDSSIDRTNPCIEWYKDDEEMLCMVMLKQQ